jgi:glycerol-3-phosphate acyltransferase PlsX
MRIALDAMGSDRAPEVEVEGALAAARAGYEVILVGDEKRLGALLPRSALSGLALEVVHASEVVGMDESPVTAARSKRDSSMRRCLELVRAGRAHAAVSAGNSGALMAGALLTLGRIPGVERAPIASVYPTLSGQAVLLDIGANVDCRASHLVQFALMGEIFARAVLDKERPRVALLSNGSEESKGTEVTREAHARLLELPLDYLGYVEGRELFRGAADVIVCDGFVGNAVLKTIEGAAEAFLTIMRGEIARSLPGKLAARLLRPSLRRFRTRLDYAEYGGAPLLGVRGVTVVCHGASTSRAVENAVHLAAQLVTEKVTAVLETEIARAAALFVKRGEGNGGGQSAAS